MVKETLNKARLTTLHAICLRILPHKPYAVFPSVLVHRQQCTNRNGGNLMLQQLTPRVYQLDFSQEQDRPVLGYIPV
ncbi:MAG: hypothetical protein ACLT3Y_08200, partial [Ruminococcus callidus]